MSRSRISRRKFVAATGTASALVLAGCADQGPGDEENESEPGNETDGEDNESGMGNGEDNESGGDETEDETYSLTVTVEDGEEEPIEGATVMLQEPDEMGDGGGLGEDNESEDNETEGGMATEADQEDETDENGEVEFTELANGQYTVTAEADEYDEPAEDDVEIDGGDEELTLTLEGGSGETTDGEDNESGDDNESDEDSGL